MLVYSVVQLDTNIRYTFFHCWVRGIPLVFTLLSKLTAGSKAAVGKKKSEREKATDD